MWDTETGFGGNGNKSAETSVFHSNCVTDGPFAGLEVLYMRYSYLPHCLSRGFESTEALKRLRVKVKPEALDELLRESHYEAFNLGLEDGPHSVIPLAFVAISHYSPHLPVRTII